jgi:GTP cyclohydrolase I
MTLRALYEYLDGISPFALQESWDNSGMLVGAWDQQIQQVVVSLDIDAALLEESPEGACFVVHHPLLFGSLKRLDFARYPANLLRTMIRKSQSLIAMHTNFDQTHLNRYVFEEILGFEVASQEGYLCTARGEWSQSDLIAQLRHRLGLADVRVVAPREQIGSITLATGAGASMLDSVSSDCFLTGDIKYHDAMKAQAQGLMLVEIGHYESECFFAEIMGRELKKLPLFVILANSKNPFTTIS